MRKLLVLLAAPVLAAALTGAGYEEGTPPFICTGPIDTDLVKVEIHTPNTDGIELKAGCTGRIGRIEVDTWTNDGVKGKAGGPSNLVIESGYIRCHDLQAGAHQDGVQMMAGSQVTFRNVEIRCGLSNAQWFVSSASADGVVCDGCNLGPDASHTANVWGATNGVRNSLLCKPETSRYYTKHGTPIDENNERAPAGDPRCA